MRNVRRQRDLGIDPRLECINRVRLKPTVVSVYRKDTGTSTIGGPRKEFFVNLYKGRVDIYGLGRGGRSDYIVAGTAQAGGMRARLEIPYPTDENGVAVDIKREDRVVYNGVNFNVLDVIVDVGYLVAGMEVLR